MFEVRQGDEDNRRDGCSDEASLNPSHLASNHNHDVILLLQFNLVGSITSLRIEF